MRYRSLVYSPENMRRTFDHALKFGARSGEIEAKLCRQIWAKAASTKRSSAQWSKPVMKLYVYIIDMLIN